MVSTKRLGMGVVVVAVVVAAGASLWLTHRQGYAYRGLASQFPQKVAVFAEMRRLGQWMPAEEGAQGQPAHAETRRGTDPMLQVLSQVWAAEPPVKSADLPDILRDRPMAAGLWRVGEDYHGVALLPLAPGQKDQLLKALKDKLGEGPVVATVADVPLRKLDVPGEARLDKAVWGVSDQWAVMALDTRDVGEVLKQQDKPLSADPEFKDAVRRFPQDRGACLFVRGADLASLIKSHGGAHVTTAAEPETGPGAPGPPETGKALREPRPPSKLTPPVPPPSAPPPATPSGRADSEDRVLHALASIGEAGLKKAMPFENIASISLWTAPPAPDQKGWQTAGWMGFKGAPTGLWRLFAEGSLRNQQIGSRVPKNGLVYVWGAGKDPARVYQTFMEELQKILTPDQMGWVRAGIGAAEGKMGLSLSNDLLPTLADEWCFVSGRGPAAKDGPAALYLTLRDPRRFEDLIANKVAPQVGLKSVNQKGARIWTWDGLQGKGAGLNLVVSGGMAIVTMDPSWALATGGDAGKAWKAFSGYGQKASCRVVMDPSLWAKDNDVLVDGACTSSAEGVSVEARFPGEAPSCGRRCEGEGAEKKAGDGVKPAASAGGSPGPAASGSP